MNGSEKQIKWADEIKQEMISSVEMQIKEYESVESPDELDAMFGWDEPKEKDRMYICYEWYLGYLKNQQSAKWFIDNRKRPTAAMAQGYYEKLGVGE